MRVTANMMNTTTASGVVCNLHWCTVFPSYLLAQILLLHLCWALPIAICVGDVSLGIIAYLLVCSQMSRHLLELALFGGGYSAIFICIIIIVIIIIIINVHKRCIVKHSNMMLIIIIVTIIIIIIIIIY